MDVAGTGSVCISTLLDRTRSASPGYLLTCAQRVGLQAALLIIPPLVLAWNKLGSWGR